MLVYADQNFLIKCRDNSDLRNVVIPAHKSGKATLVLSPMHFYELGTVREDLYERTIQFIEDVQPAWILERGDLLLHEFMCEWDRFWRQGDSEVIAVGDLAHVASAMHRAPRLVFKGLTLRDFIEPFRDPSKNQELRDVFKSTQAVHDENRLRSRKGQMTASLLRGVNRRFVAIQLARVNERGPYLDELHARANGFLSCERCFTQISIFVENGGVEKLKAHNVESWLTSERWQGEAKLKENRQVDRDHAVVALPYCDVFVTDDEELMKYCGLVKAKSAFTLATVIGSKDWTEHLKQV